MSQDRKIAQWHAWYADGHYYTSEQMEWDELPQLGVVIVLVLFDDGSRQCLNGNDIYFKFGELLQNDNDRDGLLRKFPNIKFGTWVEPNTYKAMYDQADKKGRMWHDKYYGNKPRTN